MKVWALEGLPFSGKTSGSSHLSTIDDSVLVVPDYHDLLDEKDLSEFVGLPKNPEEELQRVENYVELDRQRWRRAVSHDAGIAVLDRCHISLMAYAVALAADIGSTEESLERIKLELEDPFSPLAWPDEIVYLEMSAKTASSRCHKYARTIDAEMRGIEFAKKLIAAYENLLEVAPAKISCISSETPLDVLCDSLRHLVLEH